jgi:hypothetical protein
LSGCSTALGVSNHRDQFLLKGALLFDLWFDVPHRPTHDADFLGFGSAEIPHHCGAIPGGLPESRSPTASSSSRTP